MKLQRLHHIISDVANNQKGFTLVELLIVIAITALITGAATMAIFQVFNVNTVNSNHMAAIRQVQNAGFWISQDAQQAQIVITGDDSGTAEFEILTLNWTSWQYITDGNKGIDYVEIRYYYDAANSEIWRNEATTTNIRDDNGQLVDTVISNSLFHVAQFITSASAAPLSGNKIGVNIAATVDDANEQRTYEVSPRPST